MIIEDFITKWSGLAGGAEKANFGPFVYDLVRALDLPEPEPAEGGKLGRYQFEGPIPNASFRNPQNKGSADLYKRGCFIMEAKQSYMPPKEQRLPELFGDDASIIPLTPAGARYDKYMTTARAQVENYAKNLPASEPVAPFLIVCDIGRAFEIYYDSAGNGRGYTFFPDKQTYRVPLAKLRDPDIVSRLKAIWEDPQSIDPRFKSVDVTRTVARRLASVSQYIEQSARLKSKAQSESEKSRDIEEAALFLMRMLFCMFAEDIELLPKDTFKEFLLRSESNDDLFEEGLADLWLKMGSADPPTRFAHALSKHVRYFNGGLFRQTARTYRLSSLTIHDLYEAARQNWRKVEPAIFGTLLEQALSAQERAKLGAHYTPRPYVETLVRATIMDVLELEWENVESSDEQGLLERAISFHQRLSTVRVLDPACGTGNFLYVAMELMQTLEARVLETIQALGGQAEPSVGPHQFYGLEKNPRAAKIAELVLWIGWLRNRLHDDPGSVPEPVLAESASINFGRYAYYDAVLAQDEFGQPRLDQPEIPVWPEAEFIVGNPPFIGKGATMRKHLGHSYVEALARANAGVPPSADYVMQWWDRAAKLLTEANSPLIRFGFVTTNKIKQVFNRKIIEKWTEQADSPVAIIFAVPDHPWYKSKTESAVGKKNRTRKKDATAAIRIAMTVVERGSSPGTLKKVVTETQIDTDTPQLKFQTAHGIIHSNLTTGVDVTKAVSLRSNEGLACNGMMLAGKGFKISQARAAEFIRESPSSAKYIRPYVGGSEILHKATNTFVIDFYGLSESEARAVAPQAYEHLLGTVKKERDNNRRPTLKNKWWVFAEPRSTFRPALTDVSRFIATTESAKYRVFQFLDKSIVPDHMIIAIALEDYYALGVLSSNVHVAWTYANCGLLGVARFASTHRYTKSKCFDSFPFPQPSTETRKKISELAEELDAVRKTALREVDQLTITELYNLCEKTRADQPLNEKARSRARKAHVAIVNRLHDQIDAAVAEAYDWNADWQAGKLTESELVMRLAELNRERHEAEAAGDIQWLRPDYQHSRFASKDS